METGALGSGGDGTRAEGRGEQRQRPDDHAAQEGRRRDVYWPCSGNTAMRLERYRSLLKWALFLSLPLLIARSWRDRSSGRQEVYDVADHHVYGSLG